MVAHVEKLSVNFFEWGLSCFRLGLNTEEARAALESYPAARESMSLVDWDDFWEGHYYGKDYADYVIKN